MGKTDWENEGKPVFNSSKYGVMVPDPSDSNPGQNKIVDPNDYYNNGEISLTQKGGKITGFMPHFIDGSDAMANKGMIVSFQYVPSEEYVNFKAFITAFNETYNCDWTSDSVFGRSDPIYMFKNTQREISLAFNVPAASEGEAFENLARVQRLITFFYPTYATDCITSNASQQADVTNALTISNSPLVRLRVMNLLAARPQIGDGRGSTRAQEAASISSLGTLERHVEDGGGGEWPTTSVVSNTIAGNYHGGLLGIIKNVTVNHNLDNPDHGVFEVNQGTILPKMIEVNMTFAAVHEHTLGWFDDGNGSQAFANRLWPYGVNDASRFGEDGLDSVGPPNISALQARNALARGQMTASLDELAEEVEQFEQDVANANARYAGLFGKARFKRDIRKGRGEDNQYIASAMRGRAAQIEDSSARERAEAGDYAYDDTLLDSYRDTGGSNRSDFSEFID